MKRIRLKQISHDKFDIILPGKNYDYPIGVTWKDPFNPKSKWKIKAHFQTMLRDDHIINQVFDSSMEGARILADMFCRLGEYEQALDFIWPDDTASD